MQLETLLSIIGNGLAVSVLAAKLFYDLYLRRRWFKNATEKKLKELRKGDDDPCQIERKKRDAASAVIPIRSGWDRTSLVVVFVGLLLSYALLVVSDAIQWAQP